MFHSVNKDLEKVNSQEFAPVRVIVERDGEMNIKRVVAIELI